MTNRRIEARERRKYDIRVGLRKLKYPNDMRGDDSNSPSLSISSDDSSSDGGGEGGSDRPTQQRLQKLEANRVRLAYRKSRSDVRRKRRREDERKANIPAMVDTSHYNYTGARLAEIEEKYYDEATGTLVYQEFPGASWSQTFRTKLYSSSFIDPKVVDTMSDIAFIRRLGGWEEVIDLKPFETNTEREKYRSHLMYEWNLWFRKLPDPPSYDPTKAYDYTEINRIIRAGLPSWVMVEYAGAACAPYIAPGAPDDCWEYAAIYDPRVIAGFGTYLNHDRRIWAEAGRACAKVSEQDLSFEDEQDQYDVILLAAAKKCRAFKDWDFSTAEEFEKLEIFPQTYDDYGDHALPDVTKYLDDQQYDGPDRLIIKKFMDMRKVGAYDTPGYWVDHGVGGRDADEHTHVVGVAPSPEHMEAIGLGEDVYAISIGRTLSEDGAAHVAYYRELCAKGIRAISKLELATRIKTHP